MSAPLTMSLRCDTGALESAVAEAGRLFVQFPNVPAEVVLEVDRLSEAGSFFRTEGGLLPADGANELVVCLEPSDGFLRLLSAMRAGKLDFQSLHDSFGHQPASVGCVEHTQRSGHPEPLKDGSGSSDGGAS